MEEEEEGGRGEKEEEVKKKYELQGYITCPHSLNTMCTHVLLTRQQILPLAYVTSSVHTYNHLRKRNNIRH